jgi:hypothetical protein
MIAYLLHLCPESARVPTNDGQLPLHLYVNGGFKGVYDTTHERHRIWEDAKKLLAACPEAIRTPDVFSHLYPFQTTAASDSSTGLFADENDMDDGDRSSISSDPDHLTSLELTYLLIREDPSLCRKMV